MNRTGQVASSLAILLANIDQNTGLTSVTVGLCERNLLNAHYRNSQKIAHGFHGHPLE
jgi:hypothetical protein